MSAVARLVPDPPVATPARHRVPAQRSATVSRADLIDRLIGTGSPLVTVTAPAGFGKTTLLVEWAAVEERAVLWVTLDAADDDAVTLARDIGGVLALHGFAPESLVDDVRGPALGPGPCALRLLGDVIDDAPRSFVLIVDDAHVVTSDDGLGLIDGLVGHVPVGSQIVVAGRREPSFVSRRRVTAELVEVGSEDLAIDAVAAQRIFESEGVELAPELALEIVDRTGGWPAGVYLSVLVARRHGDELSTGFGAGGSNRYIADFLLRHVLDDLDPDLQDFVLDASLLDEMQHSLCDHALGIEGSQRLLDQLERSNLFVVGLGEEHDWYRFHSLFRDFLLAERRRRRSAEQDAVLLQRAASWCESDGLADQAIEYLLRAHDVERLGPMLTRMLQLIHVEGRATTAQRWFREAGEDVVRGYPPLTVLAGWLAAITGRPTVAEEYAEQARTMSFDGPTDDGWASFDAMRSALNALLCADGFEAMVADAELAVAGAPPWTAWRSTAIWLLGQARELAGDREVAAELYDSAVRSDLDAGRPTSLVSVVAQALVAMDSGEWDSATERVDTALQRAEVLTPANYLVGAYAHAAAARLALHRRHDARVREHLGAAMASRSLATYAVPHVAVRLRTTLAAVHARIGERATALMLLAEVDDLLAKRPQLGVLLDEVERTRALVAPEEVGAALLTPAELRVLAYLPTHLRIAQIGEELFVSRHTVHTHVGSIYRKLGVSTRADAVLRAGDLGLLGS